MNTNGIRKIMGIFNAAGSFKISKRHTDRVNGSTSHQTRQCFRPRWRVREHMAFLIRNLQFYIDVGLI